MGLLTRSFPRALSRGQSPKLSTPLLALSPNARDAWTIGDACENVIVLGSTGSGKSSGSGRLIATTFLTGGMGGLVLCAKPDEAERWECYARECGREKSIIRFDASGRYRFNFLDYFMALPPEQGGGLADNVVNALLHILEASQTGDRNGGGNADFWRKSVRELLSNAIDALYHAYGRVTLDELLKLVVSAPSSAEEAGSPDYQRSSFCYATMQKLFENPVIPLPAREAALAVSYFGQRLGRLDSRTRSNIIITLTAEVSPFLKGPLHTLFCTSTNVIPEVTHEGVILVLDLPVKRFEHTGTVAQKLVKYLWQKATERRHVDANTRPVFLFADEAQLFISPYDLEFQSTARSALAATVCITQNLPSLYAQIGGQHPQDRVDAILGNFQTKIFHANTDHRTNQWAAETIGRAMQRRFNRNWSQSESQQFNEGNNQGYGVQAGESSGRSWGSSGGFSYTDPGGPITITSSGNSGGQKGKSRSRSRNWGWSAGVGSGHSDSAGGGWSEQMDYMVQPADFANCLRQGGPRNDFLVTGVLLQANRIFSRTGTCWMPVAFRQR